MGLSRYHAKRDFKKTPEPRGKVARSAGKGLTYLIQKHAASHLHYDFRLELNGVLLSWAVPKGPSLDPADRRLAMHVEDHPVEYGGFEGTIPKGQYGGGTVMLWDRGTWIPVGDAEEGMRKGHLKFDLQGEKLQGRWALVKTHGSKYGDSGDPWLLIKDNDDSARRGSEANVTELEPDSVISGRSIPEIAEGRDKREWHSNKSVRANVRAGAVAPHKTTRHAPGRSAAKAAGPAAQTPTLKPADIEGAKRVALPELISPSLCSLVEEVPQGDGWLHEVKYDGYRMLCRLQNGRVGIYSRNGKDWTQRFEALEKDVRRLEAKSAWLDGELCAVDERGHSHFQNLQNALSGEGDEELVYFAFDLAYLDGYDLRGAALTERKRLLEDLLARSGSGLRYSPDVRGSGTAVYSNACSSGLEGIVSKRADSAYGSGKRTRDWVKVKCSLRQEMVIGGFTDPQRSRPGLGALLLGVYEDGQLRYSGKVGTGFDDATLIALRKRLNKLEQDKPAFYNPPRGYEARGAHWVAPEQVAEISFTEWSEAGALRHPVFFGLREDKKARDVVREKPLTAPAVEVSRKTGGKAKASDGSVMGNIKISNPDKPFFPEAGLTKRDIAEYYDAVAPHILPHLKGRPLSLVRCPEGWGGECFYQKNAQKSVHAAVTRIAVPERSGSATYMAADSAEALIALVQWGVIELHPWGSRKPRLARPDRLIFDFDPADDVPWAQVVEGARLLRELLQQLGLTGFLKTTGGKGLHVVLPIQPTLEWEQAKQFTKSVAKLFAASFPDRYTASVSKSKRTGRIYLDYLRNAEGATAVAPYSVRARKNAPVAMPIAWEELKTDVRFDHFNVKTAPQRLKGLKHDSWEGFLELDQRITADMFKQVGSGNGLSKSRRK